MALAKRAKRVTIWKLFMVLVDVIEGPVRLVAQLQYVAVVACRWTTLKDQFDRNRKCFALGTISTVSSCEDLQRSRVKFRGRVVAYVIPSIQSLKFVT